MKKVAIRRDSLCENSQLHHRRGIRHYSINSRTRFGKPFAFYLAPRSPREAQPESQASRQTDRQVAPFSSSGENPFSLGGNSWRSARDSLRLGGELRFPRPCSPPRISRHVEIFPRQTCARLAIECHLLQVE